VHHRHGTCERFVAFALERHRVHLHATATDLGHGVDEGGDGPIVPYNRVKVNADTWAYFDKCTGSVSTDPSSSICKTYTSCDSGTQVSFCTASAGHCGVYGSAKIADSAWMMFEKQALPSAAPPSPGAAPGLRP
jgi:hypothetical protein